MTVTIGSNAVLQSKCFFDCPQNILFCENLSKNDIGMEVVSGGRLVDYVSKVYPSLMNFGFFIISSEPSASFFVGASYGSVICRAGLPLFQWFYIYELLIYIVVESGIFTFIYFFWNNKGVNNLAHPFEGKKNLRK